MINTVSVPARRGERAQRRSQPKTYGLGVHGREINDPEASLLDKEVVPFLPGFSPVDELCQDSDKLPTP